MFQSNKMISRQRLLRHVGAPTCQVQRPYLPGQVDPTLAEVIVDTKLYRVEILPQIVGSIRGDAGGIRSCSRWFDSARGATRLASI